MEGKKKLSHTLLQSPLLLNSLAEEPALASQFSCTPLAFSLLDSRRDIRKRAEKRDREETFSKLPHAIVGRPFFFGAARRALSALLLFSRAARPTHAGGSTLILWIVS